MLRPPLSRCAYPHRIATCSQTSYGTSPSRSAYPALCLPSATLAACFARSLTETTGNCSLVLPSCYPLLLRTLASSCVTQKRRPNTMPYAPLLPLRMSTNRGRTVAPHIRSCYSNPDRAMYVISCYMSASGLIARTLGMQEGDERTAVTNPRYGVYMLGTRGSVPSVVACAQPYTENPAVVIYYGRLSLLMFWSPFRLIFPTARVSSMS